MTKRNERSVNFHESLTLRRDRECRVSRVNFRRSRVSLRRCRLDLSHLNHSREASQDQDTQSQNCDDYEKSTEMQRQESSERRDQREKRVKNSEELVQLVRVRSVKRSVDQTLNYHFRQQSRRHELRSTIQNDNAKHSKNDYQCVDQR
jgi:vacuolar-type H+-ATPase subunit I/STV1